MKKNDVSKKCETEVGQQVEALRLEFDEFKKDVKELLDIFRASKGFLKVLGWIGKGIKWIVSLGVVLGLIWAAMSGGTK